MFDHVFRERHGAQLDAIAEEIADRAGTSDGDHAIFMAAAELVCEERRKTRQLKMDIEAAIGFCE